MGADHWGLGVQELTVLPSGPCRPREGPVHILLPARAWCYRGQLHQGLRGGQWGEVSLGQSQGGAGGGAWAPSKSLSCPVLWQVLWGKVPVRSGQSEQQAHGSLPLGSVLHRHGLPG